MKKTPFLLAAVAAFSLTTPASSHGLTKPQHGGVVSMNGETLFELASTPAGVSLYVVDEDDPVNAAGMTAKLSIASGGKKTEVALVPGKGNQFFAKGLKLSKGANVAVFVANKATGARYGTTFIIK